MRKTVKLLSLLPGDLFLYSPSDTAYYFMFIGVSKISKNNRYFWRNAKYVITWNIQLKCFFTKWVDNQDFVYQKCNND